MLQRVATQLAHPAKPACCHQMNSKRCENVFDDVLDVLLRRQVALTLTPGLPPIEHVTILPRGGVQSRVLFTPVVRCLCPKLRRLCIASSRLPLAMHM
jgi:hypothetical protein